MSGDMSNDICAKFPYGKAALKKFEEIGVVTENFRLFEAEIVGDNKDTMKVHGAEFRIAKSGKNKGKLSILVKDTIKTVFVSRSEYD